jgi:hypothetical protein
MVEVVLKSVAATGRTNRRAPRRINADARVGDLDPDMSI